MMIIIDEWDVDWELLGKTFNEKTKAFLVNTPHNPTGKVFTLEELKKFEEILKKWPRVLVVEDIVYEHINYIENQKPFYLPRFAQLSEEMWNRTVSVCSAGKLFSMTGCRVGWNIGNIFYKINYFLQNIIAIIKYNYFN